MIEVSSPLFFIRIPRSSFSPKMAGFFRFCSLRCLSSYFVIRSIRKLPLRDCMQWNFCRLHPMILLFRDFIQSKRILPNLCRFLFLLCILLHASMSQFSYSLVFLTFAENCRPFRHHLSNNPTLFAADRSLRHPRWVTFFFRLPHVHFPYILDYHVTF